MQKKLKPQAQNTIDMAKSTVVTLCLGTIMLFAIAIGAIIGLILMVFI